MVDQTFFFFKYLRVKVFKNKLFYILLLKTYFKKQQP